MRSRAARGQWVRGLFVLIHSFRFLKGLRVSLAAFPSQLRTKHRAPGPGFPLAFAHRAPQGLSREGVGKRRRSGRPLAAAG